MIGSLVEKRKKELSSDPSCPEKAKKNSRKDREASPEIVEAKHHNQTFENLNFLSPFMDDINENPIPKVLKDPEY